MSNYCKLSSPRNKSLHANARYSTCYEGKGRYKDHAQERVVSDVARCSLDTPEAKEGMIMCPYVDVPTLNYN